MSVEGNVAAVRRLFRAVEERDVEPMFEIYDPEVVIREAATLPYGGVHRGHEGVVTHGLGYVETWEPFQTEADKRLDPEFFSSEDVVFVCWHQKAHAADGSALDLPVVSVYRLREGRIVESAMHHLDTAALLEFFAHAGD